MLWIGAIFGAFFGWVGILVAALFWATLAIFKLLWALALLAIQIMLVMSALVARASIWLFGKLAARTAPLSATARSQTEKASSRKIRMKRVKPIARRTRRL
jgi:membrane protein implicated in regulation of membrane protease activity